MTTQAEWLAATRTDWNATVCTADGCNKPRTGVFHTMCRRHYEKSRREKNAALAPLGFGRGCSVADCDRAHHATGLCRLHYNRMIATGSTELKPKVAKVKAVAGECEVDGCTTAKKSTGVAYCSRHATNMSRHGVPEVGMRRGGTALERFARRIEADNELGCWLWTGTKNKDGYGKFYLGGGRREVKAHRWFYQAMTGRELPRAIQLDHDCMSWDNDPKRKSCVRPSHLLEVDHVQHAANTAARKAAPAGLWHKLNDKARSLLELEFAIKHRLPMAWNT